MTPESDNRRARVAGDRLARHYRGVFETAMRDVPICNLRLDVEAIGFRSFGEAAIGIIVTPWFMNLAICGVEGCDLPKAPFSTTAQWLLPAGCIDFIVGHVEDFGRVDGCSLFSPMDDFADHEMARATAEAVLSALLDPAPSPEPERSPSRYDRRALLFGARQSEPEATQ